MLLAYWTSLGNTWMGANEVARFLLYIDSLLRKTYSSPAFISHGPEEAPGDPAVDGHIRELFVYYNKS
jgi:hypothetical protein